MSTNSQGVSRRFASFAMPFQLETIFEQGLDHSIDLLARNRCGALFRLRLNIVAAVLDPRGTTRHLKIAETVGSTDQTVNV